MAANLHEHHGQLKYTPFVGIVPPSRKWARSVVRPRGWNCRLLSASSPTICQASKLVAIPIAGDDLAWREIKRQLNWRPF